MCNMCMYCKRHENDCVLNAEAKFLNFGIFAHLPYSLYKTDCTKSNILKELKLIYFLSLNAFKTCL